MSNLTCYDCENKANCNVINHLMNAMFNMGYFGTKGPKVYNAIIGFLPEYCNWFENKHLVKNHD